MRKAPPALVARLALIVASLAGSDAAKFPRRAVVGCAALGAVGAAGIECYSRAPSWKSSDLPPLIGLDGPPLDELVIVLPGAGGPDANSERIVTSLRGLQSAGASTSRVVHYDWSAFVGDQLQAPYNAQRVGDHLAAELLRRPTGLGVVRRLHVVGISVGAFAADRLVSLVAEAGADAQRGAGRPQLRLTLLDPFTARGLLGLLRPSSAYGVGRFGADADVAQCVINTDDPVPSTSLPLLRAANYDVTSVGSRAAFTPLPGDSMHSWPAAWYGMNPTALSGREEPRGSLTVLR